MATSTFVLPSLADTLGSMFLGLVASTLLFGVTCLQVYTYFDRFPKDHINVKIAVAIAFVLDAVITATQVHYMYFYSIEKFGNFLALLEPVWSLKVQILLATILRSLVHTLYCFRVWRFSRGEKIIPIIVSLTVAAGWGVAIFTSVKTMLLTSFSEISSEKSLIYTGTVFPGAVDLIQSAALSYYLQRAKSEFAQTNSLVTRVIIMISSTALLTSVFGIGVLVAYAASPNTLIWYSMSTVLLKVSVASFMVVLNARKTPSRDAGTDVVHVSSAGRFNPAGRERTVDMSCDKMSFANSQSELPA